MLYTNNTLAEDVREKVVDLFQDRLSDAIDLLMHTKQAHWNVRGTQFIALHKLFDRVYEDIQEGVDLLAERIVQLGGIAEGTCQAVEENTSLPKYPLSIIEWKEHVEALSTSLATFGNTLRISIDKVSPWGDVASEDILIEIARNVDRNLWMVESHLTTSQIGDRVIREVA